jgi:DNA repair ATPase RecN
VEKHVDTNRTTTKVVKLAGEPRVNELANMLGDVSEGTLKSANEILDSVRATTSTKARN